MKRLILAACGLLVLNSANAANKAVTQTLDSPYVKLKSINIGDAQWTEGFWADKFKLAEQVIIPHMGTILKGDIGHAYNNFKIVSGLQEGKHQGEYWHDGDFYKWMEASMYLYAINHDEQIIKELDEIIAVIAKSQQPSGYLSTYNIITGVKPWTKRNHHELYNAGHLITAGIIHKRITGQTNFYDIAVKNADYLYRTFMPTPPELKRFGFNMSQIMALVELYRETKNKKYLALAENFIATRAPEKKSWFGDPDPTVVSIHQGDMVQERTPLRNETQAVGHAVLGMYLWSGAADIYAETGEKAILDALKRIWDSSNNRKMFVHGGIGQIAKGAGDSFDLIHEGFIHDFMMPNSRAYSETCANISNAMFNFRLMGIEGESKYADNMELVLYNSALSSISADGKHYFYTNPPRKVNGIHDYGHLNNESPVRKDYIKCFCCPPNLARTLAKLSGWAYSKSATGLSVNIFGGNTLNTQLLDGSTLKLTQETDYPWAGSIKITIDEAKAEAFDLQLRIPAWATGSTLKVNGQEAGVTVTPGKFATINRAWKKGDVINLNLPLDIKFMEGDARIEEVRNQIAVKRGPVVYALETYDLPDGTSILDAYIGSNTKLEAKYRPDFLGGLTTLEGDILVRQDKTSGMYSEVTEPKLITVKTQFVPYYAWSNRGDETNEMSIFLPVVWQTPTEAKEEKTSWWPF